MYVVFRHTGQHLFKDGGLHSGQPLELIGLTFFDLFVFHSSQLDSLFMKEVYCVKVL